MQEHRSHYLDPNAGHDACGIGAIVNIAGVKTHETVDRALCIVEKLQHRTGKDADGTTGDGVGIMTQIPHAFLKKRRSRREKRSQKRAIMALP